MIIFTFVFTLLVLSVIGLSVYIGFRIGIGNFRDESYLNRRNIYKTEGWAYCHYNNSFMAVLRNVSPKNSTIAVYVLSERPPAKGLFRYTGDKNNMFAKF
jgi:hypothetical protein